MARGWCGCVLQARGKVFEVLGLPHQLGDSFGLARGGGAYVGLGLGFFGQRDLNAALGGGGVLLGAHQFARLPVHMRANGDQFDKLAA